MTSHLKPPALPPRRRCPRRNSIARAMALLSVLVLTACDNFNQPTQPCAEISATEFESALTAGDTRGEIDISASGVVSSQIGGSLKTCRKDKTAINREVCRRSRDLVVRYQTAERGTFYVRVPAGKWHRFNSKNPPGACRLLP